MTRLHTRWARARHRRLLARLAGPRLLAAFADAYPEAAFVEIGSNDGEQHDHLRRHIREHRWRGLMVEPVPYVYERLQRNYADLDRVTCVNAAVSDHDGELEIHHLPAAAAGDPALPDYADALGSPSRDVLLRHTREIPDIADRLVATTVPCLTFASLLAAHGLERVDLLLTDTEGHDWEILRSIDLAAHHPRVVVYEHYHLAVDDRADCRSHLRAHGYALLEEGFDTFCLDTAPADALSDLWPRLRPATPAVSALP